MSSKKHKETKANYFTDLQREPMLNKKAMALFLEEPSELFHALLVDTEELGDKLILTFDFSRLSEQDRQAISEVLDYE